MYQVSNYKWVLAKIMSGNIDFIIDRHAMSLYRDYFYNLLLADTDVTIVNQI